MGILSTTSKQVAKLIEGSFHMGQAAEGCPMQCPKQGAEILPYSHHI